MASSAAFPILDPTQRPEPLQREIDISFRKVLRVNRWTLYNGSPNYTFLGQIKDHAMVLQHIKDCPPEIEEINILDVGAGGFEWGDALAEVIEPKIRPTTTLVNIYSVRGEPLKQSDSIHEKNDENWEFFIKGVCAVHHIGAFKIEEIGSALLDRGIDLVNNTHFVISHMCMPHLVDPIGTSVKILQLLAPEHGIAWMDGGTCVLEMDGEKFEADQMDLLQLMTETQTAFLRTRSLSRLAGSFLFRRKESGDPELQLEYSGIEPDPKKRGASQKLTSFKRVTPLPTLLFSSSEEIDTETLLANPDVFIGDRGLFEWLQRNNLFSEGVLPVLTEL